MGFQHTKPYDWQSYSSVHSADGEYIAVAADKSQTHVRVAVQGGGIGFSFNLSPERARELAAEMIAAADSLAALKVAA